MGAPKQKWTQEEEAALKAGVIKHGAGKWRTILKDPEFSGVLYLRSNVDLKDKWRNMSVMANGWGSREKARLAVKRVPQVPKQEENSMALGNGQSDEELVDTKPVLVSSDRVQVAAPKRSIVRLDNLIFEAITSLKESGGSNKTTIATYIEEQYWAPPDFKRLLSAKLKYLTANGKLIKVKRRYRIAPTPSFSDRRRNSSTLVLEGRQRVFPKVEKDDAHLFTKSQIDIDSSSENFEWKKQPKNADDPSLKLHKMADRSDEPGLFKFESQIHVCFLLTYVFVNIGRPSFGSLGFGD
ncbi:telomere repeat-binding factor 1-like isoform X3 [Fagus crenata]